MPLYLTAGSSFLPPVRGWNSWVSRPLRARTPSATPSYQPDHAIIQAVITDRCTVLTDPDIRAAGYDLCSLDGRWCSSITDKFERLNPPLSHYEETWTTS
ncbi:hypothetical protein BDW66DRAFT_128897 [Aspergillus desertorum]